MSTQRTRKTSPSSGLRRLDFLPPWAAWALGIGGGAFAGAVLAGAAPGALGVIGFLGLLGAAARLAASGEPIAVVERAETPGARPLLDLVEIPGGSFLMGSPESEEGRFDVEGPVHEVQLSSFSCMRFQVTRHLYTEIMGKDPGWPKGTIGDRPVNNVTWFDAVEFCNRLSEREKFDLCYQVDGERVLWNRAAGGYRLLTEAEWEYACRACTTTSWSFGDDERRLSDYAWFVGNSNGEPQPVGGKLPNAWGFHDMHGNVWEWCWDWFGPYIAVQQADPTGPEKGVSRAIRGGAIYLAPSGLRSAIRVESRPATWGRGIGFRCARSPSRSGAPTPLTSPDVSLSQFSRKVENGKTGWAVSLLAAWDIRLLRATVRLRHHGAEQLRRWEKGEQRVILAFWHRHLLLMPYAYQGRRISVLVNQSRDGDLIARTMARLGIDSSRGSSSRGGNAGMRSLLRKAAEGWDIAITPDGPRGPATEVQPAVILAAAATGLPIVPVALAASRAKRLHSWDRLLVPLPLSTVHFVYGEPLAVERRGDLGLAAAELKRRLDSAEAEAERWAMGHEAQPA